ncbi:MAG: mandelate racemase/muconate lactonizing enzyme family protein [Parvibaculum sp.]|nr:mandelate racemase/muconate lactonizing enzyme family protein [Parvibaculum sp.]|tara:strand:- start:9683 stop:10795 length:1113 start_codon:yes stop_codon:yes gene_type:complete
MARIEHAEIFLVPLTPKVTRFDAIQQFVCQETVIVRLYDADGAIGTGYSYTIGTGGSSVVALLVDHLLPQVIGREAEEIESIWRDLKFHTHATTVGAITSLALAAIDTALWDLRALRAKLPLHVIAGGARKKIPAYTTEGGWLHLSTEELVEGAQIARRDGFHGVKIKIGKQSVKEDVRRVAAVREALGDELELMIDCNQSFAVDEAIRRAHALQPFDLAWMEEPLPADDLDGHIRLAASTPIPVAVGESIYGIRHFRDYLQQRACSVVQVDCARIGGITPWLKTAHLAEAFNVAVAPHFLMELHVSLACAVSNGRWVEYIPQLDEITTSRLRIEKGMAFAPEAPGLGIEWDWDAVRRLSVIKHDLRKVA